MVMISQRYHFLTTYSKLIRSLNKSFPSMCLKFLSKKSVKHFVVFKTSQTPLRCHKNAFVYGLKKSQFRFLSNLETNTLRIATNYKLYGRCILIFDGMLFHLTEPRP